MTDGSVFPQWLLDAACGDEDFDAAYSGLSGERRAWIKKTAAQVFEMSGAGDRRCRTEDTCWTQGFSSSVRREPVDGALLLFDADCLSPVRVAAAALPAVASGAQCAAACMGGDPAPDVLAALELCGLETVARCSSGDMTRLVEHAMAGDVRLAAVVLGAGAACEEAAAMAFAAPGLRVWTPWTFPVPNGGPDMGRPDMGIWVGDGAAWDFDLVAWAQAGHEVAVWSAPGEQAPGPLPSGMTAEQGTFDDFLAAGYRALLVPDGRSGSAARAADLVLCPGQEACWAWPGLTSDFFLLRRLCLSGGA